jgi:hypothetical protein
MASIGFALFDISDFTFVVRPAHGAYLLGGPTDLGWIAGWAMITLAIVAPDTSENPQIEPLIEAAPIAGTTLTFGSFGLAAVASLVKSENIGTAASVLWLTVLLAVTTRRDPAHHRQRAVAPFDGNAGSSSAATRCVR